MGTTIFPMPAGGLGDDEGDLAFVPQHPVRLREAKKKKPKEIIKEAQGVLNPKRSKPKKVVKPTLGKQDHSKEAKTKSKNRGPFGEFYKPVSAGKKGIRSAE